MKKISVSMLFLVLFSSCKSKDCAVLNYELINRFEKEIKIVKDAHRGREVYADPYRNAFIYLSDVTGIVTSVQFGDIPSYKSNEDYFRDIKAWENWLEQNRCLPKTN